MLSTTTIALAFGLAASSAVAQNVPLPQGYHWDVTNWGAQGGLSGVSYDFNVTGARPDENLDIPGFEAHCSGMDVGYFTDCDIFFTNASVAALPDSVGASLAPVPEHGNATISVSLQYSYQNGTHRDVYNITGTATTIVNAFVAPAQNFSIVPTSVARVA